MKTCSSWNWDTLDYTYYSCPGTQSAGGWNPPASARQYTDSGIGVHIEDALPALPSGCTVTGHGVAARGQIVKPVSNGLSGTNSTVLPLVGAAVVIGAGLALYGVTKQRFLPGLAGAALLYGLYQSGLWSA